MTVDTETELKNSRLLEGGRVATYRFKGFEWELNQTYKGLVNIWLPQCAYELRGEIGCDEYRNHCFEAGQVELEIDIHIPIK
jgi:DNA gyrase inhibitor GyrI